nr:GNAT family protein [Oceanobacillus bengalensis]
MIRIEVNEHIVLKQLEKTDAKELFQRTDDSRDYLREWLPWVDGTTTVKDSLAFIEHTLESFEAKRGITFGIFYKEQLTGSISYNSIDWTNKIGFIGYWLSKDYQGLGLMTDAVRALIDYGFYDLGLNRIDIRAAYENNKSRALPERLGFIQEGRIRQTEWLYDHYVDHVIYGMLKNDWEKK